MKNEVVVSSVFGTVTRREFESLEEATQFVMDGMFNCSSADVMSNEDCEDFYMNYKVEILRSVGNKWVVVYDSNEDIDI